VSKELIERADRFYAVARELEADAAFTLRCAEMLNRHADAMCELNMKNQKPPADLMQPPVSNGEPSRG